MFFQFSPIRTEKKTKPAASVVEENNVEILNLAPFSPNPRISFNNVPIGQSATRQLLIRNPTKDDIQLFISKYVPDDLDFKYSWTENTIPKNDGEILLELIWKPLKEGSFCHSFTLENGKKLRRDVLVSFKSLPLKQPKKTTAKTTTRPARKHSPKKSPKVLCLSKARKISPTKGFSPKRNQLALPQIVIRNTEKRETFISKSESEIGQHRRETFIVKSAVKESAESALSPVFSDDSLDKSRNSLTPEFHKLQYRRVLGPSQADNMALDLTTHQRKFEEKLNDFDFGANVENTGFKDLNLSASTYIHEASFRSDCFNPSKYQFSPENRNFYSTTNLHNSKESLISYKENLIPSKGVFETDKENCTLTKKLKEITFSPPVLADLRVQKLSTPNLEQKLQNINFTPINSTDPHQFHCSTEEKSINLNVSSLTYVKESSYKENITFTRSNSPLSSLSESVSAKSVIEANLWIEPPPLPAHPPTINRRPIKRRILSHSDISPAKSPKLEQFQASSNILKRSNENWSKRDTNVFRIAKSSSGLKINSAGSTVINDNKVIWKNSFLMAATNMIDPFMTSNLFVDEEWIDQQESYFKKWLNALLTPPEELESQEHKIDVAKVWQNIKKSENANETFALSKETVSLNYHKSLGRLNSLRRVTAEFYRRPEIVSVLSKVMKAVDVGKIQIRTDRDIFLNLGLKSQILQCILSYNSLWLRIGLETVFNVTLNLQSNSDVMGLSTFIAENLFKSQSLLKKYGSVMAPNYYKELNKHFLKKFFALVYFLDQAKNSKLIAHDPCLFKKSSDVKESRQILIIFAREAIAAIGDITKYLKYFGYIVTHKQTYIHEFDYAVKHLGGDLRDGVRLARVMEIILLQDRQLTDQLRVPAISRLQKIHNVKLTFNALEKAGFKILNEIEPKDIVDGHKEKTLSFLWQIIYKFEAPLMVKSCTTIQKWFRSFPICLKRLQLRKVHETRQNAVKKIQRWYRNKILFQNLTVFVEQYKIYLQILKRERAAILIQSLYRRYRCRSKYLKIKHSVIKIQSYCRRYLVNNYYHHRIKAAIVLQKHIRRYLAQKSYSLLLNRYRIEKSAILKISLWYKATKLMQIQRNQYRLLRNASIFIQNQYRELLQMRKQRSQFLLLKKSTIVIQRQYRAQKSMKIQRNHYLQLRQATVTIQNRFRANKLKKIHQRKFKSLRVATILIQSRFRALIFMRNHRKSFLLLKRSTLLIQQKFRAQKLMRIQRNHYLQLRQAAITVQNRFRANKLKKIHKEQFQLLRSATILIQSRFRALLKMRNQRKSFLLLKRSTLFIQQRLKAKKLMRIQRYRYLQLRKATIAIQNRFRANKLMKIEKNQFESLRKAVTVIKNRYKALKIMKQQQSLFNLLKKSAIVIQRHFRAMRLMRTEQNRYKLLRSATITIQSHYRALILMRKERNKFLLLYKFTVLIQQRFRAQKLMKIQRNQYCQLRSATIAMQNRFRANKLMKTQKNQYGSLRNASIIIQNRFRALLKMRNERFKFLLLKKSTITIQRRYLAQKLMKTTRNHYLQLRQASIKIQNRFRANKLKKLQQEQYEQLKHATLVIQSRLRAMRLMKTQRKSFLLLKASTLLIQQRLRAQKSMRVQRNAYLQLRRATIIIQCKFRANKLMKKERNQYEALRNAVITIQNRYRALHLMKTQYTSFELLKKSTIVIQQRFRALQLMRVEQRRYKTLRCATITIQNHYKALLLMRQQRNEFKLLKKNVILVQQRFKAQKLMKIYRSNYQNLRRATIIIQNRFRSLLMMRKQRNEYKQLKKYAIVVQQRFRAKRIMILEHKKYSELRKAVITIQRRFRANKFMKNEKNRFDSLKRATLLIQTRYRAIVLMKNQKYKFNRLKNAAVTIQQQFRAQKLMRMERKYFASLKKYVIVIQQKYRAKLQSRIDRSCYLKFKWAVNVVENRYIALKLMRTQKSYFTRLKQCTVFIQTTYKNKKLTKHCRNHFIQLKKSAAVIQVQWRAFNLMRIEREKYQKLVKSVITIKSFYKGYKLAQKLREEFLYKRNSIIKIQKVARGYLIRKKYAEFLSAEGVAARKRLRQQTQAALRIQALWRGYKVRRNSSNEVLAIRQGCKVANQKATPQNTLANRVEEAIMVLSNERSTLLQVIKALSDFEFITRRCRKTCLSTCRFLPRDMYVLLAATARSFPEMEICTHATRILINYCKLPDTRETSFVPEQINVIILLMMHWCDKESALFPSLCTLLWLFAHNNDWRQHIISSPNFEQQFSKIGQLCDRKFKMVQKTGVKGSSVFEQFKNPPLPGVMPDWGLDYKHRPYVFTNSMFAFKCLRKILLPN